MKDVVRRWLPAAAQGLFLSTILASGTGCGALAAAANPKVAWALNDPAPMSVVVRRADVAEKTAQNVDRLMTDTPANDDSEWLTKVTPDQDEAKKELVELRKHDLYLTNVKIVAAEVWAKNLSGIQATTAAAKPAPAKEPEKSADAVASNDAATADDQPAPTPKAGKKGVKGGKGVAKKGEKKQSKVVARGASSASPSAAKKAGKKGSKPAAAPADDDASASATATATTTTTSASVPAGPPSANAKYVSLLAAIDKDLGEAWDKVMDKKKAIGDVKGQIATLEAQNDAKETSEADKQANKKQIDELDKQVDALDKEASQLAKDFIPKAKEAAKKTPADVREKLGPVLVNLQKAVDDANIANGAAAVRYPMAATTIVDSAKTMAKVYVADIVEEKTGKRPNMQSLQPGVSLEGGSVNVTLNGLDSSDMGKLNVGEVSKEAISRTTAWVKRAMGLLGTISSTKEVLSFEDDVISAILDGFKSGGYAPPAAATIPEAPPAAGAPQQQQQASGGNAAPGGLSMPRI